MCAAPPPSYYKLLCNKFRLIVTLKVPAWFRLLRRSVGCSRGETLLCKSELFQKQNNWQWLTCESGWHRAQINFTQMANGKWMHSLHKWLAKCTNGSHYVQLKTWKLENYWQKRSFVFFGLWAGSKSEAGSRVSDGQFRVQASINSDTSQSPQITRERVIPHERSCSPDHSRMVYKIDSCCDGFKIR